VSKDPASLFKLPTTFVHGAVVYSDIYLRIEIRVNIVITQVYGFISYSLCYEGPGSGFQSGSIVGLQADHTSEPYTAHCRHTQYTPRGK